MSQLSGLLDPSTIAIVGLSSDPSKHGRRVLRNLVNLGFAGQVWGVNPGLPRIDGVGVYPTVGDLPRPPDLVVSAVPGEVATEVIAQCSGVGAIVVFAGGFGETGPGGLVRQNALQDEAARVGVRMLGPNSAGVIRPGRRLAASFLSCLDRPSVEIRTGPVGVVTQSGGVGSYLHNLAAQRSGGLAISVSTGNEGDVKLGEALAAVADLEEVAAVLALVETIRDGPAFIGAIESARSKGKPVIVCRLGTTDRGKTAMRSHTGAMAVPEAVLSGVLASMGVVETATPGEAYEVAELLARSSAALGSRSAIVTHSGGMAVLLADLAERHGVTLPSPSHELRQMLEPLLDHGAAANPVDMGGIMGGPTRFAQVIDVVASSGEYDSVLAVSTPHPPAHTRERVVSLLAVQTKVRLLHLWLTGGQGTEGLQMLRSAGVPSTEDPQAAMRALAVVTSSAGQKRSGGVDPVPGGLEDWGLPLVERRLVSSSEEAADGADELGYPVVLKVHARDLFHKTEVGGVRGDLRDRGAVESAFDEVMASSAAAGSHPHNARIERYRPGLEVIVGAVADELFGPLVSVGLGGIFTELLNDVVFAPAPVDPGAASAMIDRLQGRRLLDGFRTLPAANVYQLAEVVSLVSRGFVSSNLSEVEINPLIWDGTAWVAVDWIVVSRK
jgi:acyl-CoA synthetase (NDP forming)